MSNEFGAFLKQKRKALGESQRAFAKMVGVSYSYISSIEIGNRPAPSAEIINRMERELKLERQDKELFEHLAAKSRAIPTVSPKIASYVNNNDCVFRALSFAESNHIEEKEWREFFNKIKKKYN